VDYLVGGALAAAVWGEPRSTLDVDLVIDLPAEQIPRLSAELERRDILIPPDLMLDILLESRGDIALVGYHLQAGYKAELFPLRPGDALRTAALQRRVRVELEPPLGAIYVHSPEDLILYKLSYYDISGQTKHVRDIVAILLARGPALDARYLDIGVERLHLQTAWRQIAAEARALGAGFPGA
jgi:hypothetical protein